MTLQRVVRFTCFIVTLTTAAASTARLSWLFGNPRVGARRGIKPVRHSAGTHFAQNGQHRGGAEHAIRVRGGGFDGSDRRSSSQGVYPGQTTWIQTFCRTPGNEFFAEVPESFIRESMNLIDIGRGVEIPYYKEALGVLLGETRVSTTMHGDAGQKASMVQSSAALLYGLLHARFLVSPQGLQVVLEKFAKAEYGRCPRVYCQGQAVLPVGETDRPMQSSVRVFCPRCGDLYYPSGYVRACDGAFWGTTLPHLLLLGWPELRTAPNTHHYVPRVYGFKIHAQARESGLENTRSNGAHRGEEGDQTKGAART